MVFRVQLSIQGCFVGLNFFRVELGVGRVSGFGLRALAPKGFEVKRFFTDQGSRTPVMRNMEVSQSTGSH